MMVREPAVGLEEVPLVDHVVAVVVVIDGSTITTLILVADL